MSVSGLFLVSHTANHINFTDDAAQLESGRDTSVLHCAAVDVCDLEPVRRVAICAEMESEILSG
jgi:hypothetical protein